MFPSRTDRPDIADRLRQTADHLVELVGAQLRLTRLELTADARTLASRLTKAALFVPLVVVGYALVMVAAGAALGRWVGLAWGLVIVGGANFVIGMWGLSRAVRGLEGVRVLDRSRGELERSLERVAAAVHPER